MGVSLSFRPWKGAPGHRSLWLSQAFEKEPELQVETLHGDLDADVCIVGGGFTGLWTAIRLKENEPGISVAIVEADLCGGGASGRNSGGVGHWWSKLPALIKLLGPDDAKRVLKASVDSVDDIAAFIRQHDIDCELRHGLSVSVATAPAQIGAWKGAAAAARSVGLEVPQKPISTEELRDLLGDGPHLAGMVEEHGTRVQPALLARGLRKIALALGVKIFEQTPVLSIDSAERGVLVRAAGGTVRAGRVVLAANAWMAHLPAFRRNVMVLSSDIIYTAPIPELLRQHGLTHRPGSRNYRMMLNYGGVTPDGRVYLGRGGGSVAFNARITDRFHWSPEQAREIEEDFRFLYPQLRDVRIAGGWAGPIDRSVTGLPMVGTLPDEPRIFYAIGYTGHGVGATALVGRMLAARLTGRVDERAELFRLFETMGRGAFPPEPIRYVGARVVRAAVARKERAEQKGEAPMKIDKSLARLAVAAIPARRPESV